LASCCSSMVVIEENNAKCVLVEPPFKIFELFGPFRTGVLMTAPRADFTLQTFRFATNH